MSATDSPARRGWHEGRARRARMFAALLVGCAVVALWATFQPWFAWATPGLAPSCEPAPVGAPTISISLADGSVVDGVSARGCVTGAQTAQTTTSREGTAAGVADAQQSLSSVYNRAAPAAAMGLPRTTVVLVGCLAVAALGVWYRRGWVAGLALFALRFAHGDLADVRTYNLTGSGAELATAMVGLQYFTWALLVGSALTLTAMVFVMKVNFEARAEARRAARAAGEEDPAEPLDVLTSYLGRKIHKVKSAAADAERVTVDH